MAFSLHFNTVSFILILISLVFLILATISAPVVSTFRLATTDSYQYGIFGYCHVSSGSCSKAMYPFTVSSLDKKIDWLLASSTRDTLAKIFILAPIAAGINLLTLILIGLSHLFASTVLLITLVANAISFIITALICVIVIIVFHPQVSWTAWILVGSAAANLISIIFLVLTLKLRNNDYDNEDDDDSINNSNDLTKFDDKFNHIQESSSFEPPVNGGYGNVRTFDDNSSISKDYEYKVSKPTPYVVQKSISNSSIYNSNPQLVNDFTNQSNNQINNPNQNAQNAQNIIQKPPTNNAFAHLNSSNSSYYEDANVNLVNGPNTPILAKQQMAPNVVPKVATPTSNDLPTSNIPQLPYPQNNNISSPLNRQPYDSTVFEHHPEVEGHKPFTELNDDEDEDVDKLGVSTYNNRNSPQNQRSVDVDSDNDSDFTSVSQRAINPKYYPQGQPSNVAYYQTAPQQQPQPQQPHLPHQHYPQQPQQYQQHPNASPYQPQYPNHPQYAQNNSNQGTPYSQQGGYFPQSQSQQMPQQSYNQQPNSPPIRQNRGPTVADRVLNNNPDFALSGFSKRKQYGGGANTRNIGNGNINSIPNASKFGSMIPPSTMGPGQRRTNGFKDSPYGR